MVAISVPAWLDVNGDFHIVSSIPIQRMNAMKKILPDIEIAQAASKLPIQDIAAKLNISVDNIIPYGHDKAKIAYGCLAGLNDNPDGKSLWPRQGKDRLRLPCRTERQPGRQADTRDCHIADAGRRRQDDDDGGTGRWSEQDR
jgi:hypothetical protein